jgi:hypothetical protein
MPYTYVPLNLNSLDLTKPDQLQQFQFQLCDFLNALLVSVVRTGTGGGGTGTIYSASESVLLTGTNFTLVGDVATPVNGQFYGYSAGARGWVAPPGYQMIWGETPTGAINGVNKNYTSANNYTANLLAVFLNGLRQQRTNDYTETGSNSFSFVNAPLSGDSLIIDYVM